MVSSSPNTASDPNGSCASSNITEGPAAVPKVPIRNGDTESESSDVPAESLNPAAVLTVNCSAPTTGGVSTVASSIVTTKVIAFV